jgi:hypothetical protein
MSPWDSLAALVAVACAWYSGYCRGRRTMARKWLLEKARVDAVNQQRLNDAIAAHTAAVQAEWDRRVEHGSL